MFSKCRTLVLACLLTLMALGWGSVAQAQQFLLEPDSGGQLQIGTGLPLPVGTAGIFTGGMSVGDASNFPPLLVPPPAVQDFDDVITGTPSGALQIPPEVLQKAAAGSPVPIGVFPTNQAVFQVATSISYAWPNAAATLAPGGGPGMTGGTPVTLTTTTPNGGQIIYNGGPNAFGGPAQFSISGGPGASGGAIGPNAASVPPIASVWINFQAASTVGMASQVGLAGASNPYGFAQPGASVAATGAMTAWGPVLAGNGGGAPGRGTGGVRLVNYPGCCTIGPLGTIDSSIGVNATFPSNMVTNSKGFPWSTGLISITVPTDMGGTEQFFLSGTDMRTAGGAGNIQLVSGSLSDRALSGPNANRGWLSLTLPEPTAALGAAGALGVLGLCHGLVRRRSR